jgi:iron complex transport system ATP-binding protein
MKQNKQLKKQLSTRGLSLGYNGKIIINSLDLTIPVAKITILVGANGCGKSTLLRGLGRLLQPSAGQVYLDGKSLRQLSSKKLAQYLGILTQNPIVPEGLTVRDLVAFGRYPYQTWLQQWSKEDEMILSEALTITGMRNLANRSLDTLSGGQRQRAWIAMTLAQNTEIVLLDEPTTFLDLAHQVEILDLLYELNQTQQRTIVMVLHDLNQACRYGDYLIAVKNGRIFSQGEPQLVMTTEMVKEVFGLNCLIVPDPVVGTPMCVPACRKIHQQVSY